MTKVIIDSNLTPDQAVKSNPAKGECPKRILNQQALITVHYYGFDGVLHRGQIVVHEDVTTDIHEFFELAESIKFPLAKVVPLAHPDYLWDRDKTVLQDNLTYGFNWRKVPDSDIVSSHAHGLAIDVNPMQNPYIYVRSDNHMVWPPVKHDPTAPGTLTSRCKLVKFMESRGWVWGGHPHRNHEGRIELDYMHFSKTLS